jgi:glutamate--cysteine ligase
MSEIIKILEQKISAKGDLIADFFAKKFAEVSPLFYNSVDLRHSDFKIAPVDTNCFPAGFNNLSETSEKLAEKIADDFFNQNFPDAKKILIIPENHTRNFRYLKNVINLQKILGEKREVIIGTLVAEFLDKTVLDLENGESLTVHPLIKKDGKIITKDGFIADAIVLNNDLTDGIPEILQNVSTPIVPAPNMGWHRRTKSNHFTIYNKLAEELALILEIDPWLISSMHSACDNVNFKEQEGIERLAKYVDELLKNLQKKYQEYGINEEPYCYIKADNGTYGIAVWPVFSATEVLEINKKERNKMNMLKGSVQNTHVIIQEGIKTIDKIDDKIAEPMIYMINAEVVANLFRVNSDRDEKISLNAAGASFFDLENLSENQLKIGAKKNKITEVYSLIARLAALASSIENSQIKND